MVHNTGNTQDSYSATIIGTNGPVDGHPGRPGWLAGAIDSRLHPARPLDRGQSSSRPISGRSGQGTVTVEVESLTSGAIIATAIATVGTSVAVSTAGPEVTEVQRFGYHMMPTTLVLTFDQALDPATAEDAHNYRIIGPHGRTIRVKSAVYDPTTLTVTLHPSRRINIHHRTS